MMEHGHERSTNSLARRREFDDSTRIRAYRPQITRIASWIRKAEPLPPPSLMVLFPTYRCTAAGSYKEAKLVCPNCIYASLLGEHDLDPEVALRTVYEAVEMGVRNIQLSGGGEPLQYHYLPVLLDVLAAQKSATPGLELGLLTNGLHLEPAVGARIARLFSYVRLSFAEGYQGQASARKLFTANFAAFLVEAKKSPRLRVGLKLLLQHDNAVCLTTSLADLVKDLSPSLVRRLDHIRVKAMRSVRSGFEPTDEDKRSFLRKFHDLLHDGRGMWPSDIQVDLDLGYVASDFRCGLSPLCAVIDPKGNLMACYNYVDAYEELRIGELQSEPFRALWGSERHRHVVRGINAAKVCNSPRGCPCRFAKYQEILRRSRASDEPETPPEVTRLL